jgi:hypothetical protein
MRYHFVVCFHWGEINPLQANPLWYCYDEARTQMKKDLADNNVAWDATEEWLWLSLDSMRQNAERSGLYVPTDNEFSHRYSFSATPDMISGAFEAVEYGNSSDARVIMLARYNTWPWNHAKGSMRAIAAAMGAESSTVEQMITSFKETYYDGGWYDQLVKAGIPTPVTYIWRDGPALMNLSANFQDACLFFEQNRDSWSTNPDGIHDPHYFLKTYKALNGKWMGGKLPYKDLYEGVMEALRWIDRDETLMIREFVPIMTTGAALGLTPLDADYIEDPVEWRYIFHNGNLIAKGPNRNYLPADILRRLNERTDEFLALAVKANSALATDWNCLDIALTATGIPFVVEVNAGISSGLPWNSAPNYYENLFASIIKREDSKL